VATWRKKTYDELPALSVRRKDLRKSLRIVTAGFVLAMLWTGSCQGAHMPIFGKMLGFTDFHFGLLASMAYLATLGQLVAAILIERTGLRKFQFIECMSLARGLWLTVAAIPLLLPAPSPMAVYAMILVLLVSNFLTALAAPAWMTWMGDLIPRRIRGRYLGNRSLIGAMIRLPFVIAIGITLDQMIDPALPETAAAQPALLRTICIIFAVGGILGTIDILLFHRIREVLPTTPAHEDQRSRERAPLRLRELLWEPLRDRVFRRYVLYAAIMTFAMTVGGSYYWLNAMENLGFSKLGTNIAFMVIGPLAWLPAARWWGKLIDRWGRRPVLMLATLGTVFSTSGWFFVTRHTMGPAFVRDMVNWLAGLIAPMIGRADWIWVTPDTPVGAYLVACAGCALGAVCWGGMQMTHVGVLFGYSDGKGRSKYVAVAAVFIGMGGVLGGLTGGVITSLLHSFRFDQAPLILGPFLWTNWHAAFFLSMLARIAALISLIHMPDPGSKPVRHIMRMVGANVYNFVGPRLFYRLRVFNPRRRNGDNDRKRPPRIGRGGSPSGWRPRKGR